MHVFLAEAATGLAEKRRAVVPSAGLSFDNNKSGSFFRWTERGWGQMERDGQGAACGRGHLQQVAGRRSHRESILGSKKTQLINL